MFKKKLSNVLEMLALYERCLMYSWITILPYKNEDKLYASIYPQQTLGLCSDWCWIVKHGDKLAAKGLGLDTGLVNNSRISGRILQLQP